MLACSEKTTSANDPSAVQPAAVEGAWKVTVDPACDTCDGSEIRLEASDWTAGAAREHGDSKDTLLLQLPTPAPEVTVPVIELFLK